MEFDIPDEILTDNILSQLRGDDLKSCRGVCRDWNRLTSPLLTDKTCAVFDGHKRHPLKFLSLKANIPFLKKNAQSKALLNYLDKSETKFSLWDVMRLRKMSTAQANTLLQNWDQMTPENLKFNQVLQTVTKLEIVKCQVEPMPFMKLLSYFVNVDMLVDDKSVFYTPSLLGTICQSVSQIEETMSKKYGMTSYPFKIIAIKQHDVDANTKILLRLLDITCKELEGFGLEMQNERNFISFTRRAEFCNRLGFFLLKHSGTLKKLSLQWFNHEYDHFFDDCIRVIRVLGMNSTTIAIEELELGFQWIFLNNPEIENILIPFVGRLRKLKKFAFQKVILAGQSSLDILQSLKPPGSDMLFELGGLICDQPTADIISIHDSIRQHRNVLQSDFCVENLHSLLVTFDTSSIHCLEFMLPLFPAVKFANIKEFSVSCRRFDITLLMEIFCNFNIPILARTIPNLTELRIFDGPPHAYASPTAPKQYDSMSAALIGNHDMQAIISELQSLRKIKIRGRMSILTDSGLTGLTFAACCRMNRRRYYEIIEPMNDYDGLKLSELKYLTELSLQGVSHGLTNVTAFHAFEGCENLKEVNLYGGMAISRIGKEYLRRIAHHRGIKFSTNI